MLRQDISDIELQSITNLLHLIKPALVDYSCVGIEKPKLGDRNVIFHMSSNVDSQVVMITADYFLR
jgi:hypothetical protein